MNLVEDSGTSLATPSQRLYLSGDAGVKKDEIKAAAKTVADRMQDSGEKTRKRD
jgi:hypothetical protein